MKLYQLGQYIFIRGTLRDVIKKVRANKGIVVGNKANRTPIFSAFRLIVLARL